MSESTTAHSDKKSKNKNEDPLGALTDWSKWLIGINFAGATGCLVVLKAAAENSPTNTTLLHELQWAILAFCLSALCAIILIFCAAIPNIAPKQKIEIIGLICTLIGGAQIIFFVGALVFLNLWVCTKANAKVDECIAQCQNLKKAAASADKK